MGKTKPAQSNSALRYLWARHRITLLSDYNQLRARDGRIKEITDLGLAYNLLTAYTSFVAIDKQARNESGQQATVQQPLPLPQGVSDYAVGGMRLAQAPGAFLARKEAAPLPSSESRARRDEPKEKDQRRAALGEITVSGNLAKDSVYKALQQKTRELTDCAFANENSGEFFVELTVAPDGRVTSAKLVSASLKDKTAESCLMEKMKSWQFQVPRDGREGKVKFSFVIVT